MPDSSAPRDLDSSSVDEGKEDGKIRVVWMDLRGSMDVFEIIFVVDFVVGTVVRKAYTYRSRGDKAASKRKSVLDIVLVSAAGAGLAAPLLYLLTPWLGFADYDRPAWLGWVGVVVFSGAILLLDDGTYVFLGNTLTRLCDFAGMNMFFSAVPKNSVHRMTPDLI